MKYQAKFLKKLITVIALFTAMVTSLSSCASEFQVKKTEEISTWIDGFWEKVTEDDPAAGMTVLIGKGSDVILSKGVGYADLENNIPSKSETNYNIASITKQFTAVAILKLEEQGKLKLEDNINVYLPDYPTHGEKITIANLLYHTSGIKNYIRVGYTESRIAPGRTVNDAEYRLDLRPDELTSFFRNEPLEYKPGTQWRYSNAGYYLAGLIIEKVSGMSYEQYIETQLFDVANMGTASYSNPEEIVKNRAQGYKVKDGVLLNANLMNMSVPYSAGALASTVKDLFLWNRALHSSKSILGDKAYKKLITPGKLSDGKNLPMNYALGLAVVERDGYKAFMHPGGINGFSGMLAYFPDQDMSVVVLTNTYNKKSKTVADKIEAGLSAYLLDSDLRKFSVR